MRTLYRATLSLGLTLAALCSPATAQKQWAVTNTFHIGGEGSWDYVTVDPQTHRLFLPRTTHTIVVDGNSGKVLGDIPGQKHSHGVAIVPKLNRGFITDGGGSGMIQVFDLKTYATIGHIATMPDSDGIIYDPKLDLILAVSGDGNALMSFHPNIDPSSGKPEVIQLGGAPEFLASDGSGKVYVNLEDKDTVAVVDVNQHKVVARWPVTPGGSPVGMAIDPAGHHIFIGCRKPQKLVVMNTDTGKVDAALPIGTGVDATVFSNGQAFASTGDGNLTVASEKSGKFAVEQTVKTAPGARTMGLDSSTHRLYLPTAELLPAAGGGRPQPKPGTFMVLVVESK